MTATERFWLKVDKSGDCWLWTAGRTRAGYGSFHPIKTKSVHAHRYAYQMEHGEIPSGLEVCHRCNNKPCVRPSHLYAATHRTNMIDAMRDGLIKNMQKGGQLWNAKLTEEAVREIRIAHSRGEAYRALSRRFGVGRMQIKRIVLKERWAHVE